MNDLMNYFGLNINKNKLLRLDQIIEKKISIILMTRHKKDDGSESIVCGTILLARK